MTTYTVGLSDTTKVLLNNEVDSEDALLDALKESLTELLEEMAAKTSRDDEDDWNDG